ncbi:MAG: hypothetical protein HC842_01990 [Cytophagales bacterium]|nr:hypothetical protein [Cytophagales bacterium]
MCHEPHSPVVALAQGTPIIHTWSAEYGPKYHMFADMGLAEWLFEHDSTLAQTLIHTLMNIHQHYDQSREKVQNAMHTVQQRQAESMAVLRQIMDK